MLNPNLHRFRNPTLIHGSLIRARAPIPLNPGFQSPQPIQPIQRREREIAYMASTFTSTLAMAFLSMRGNRAPVATRDVVAQRERRVLGRGVTFEAPEFEGPEEGTHGYEAGGRDRYAGLDERPDHGCGSRVWDDRKRLVWIVGEGRGRRTEDVGDVG
jgi:hypothetical protein